MSTQEGFAPPGPSDSETGGHEPNSYDAFAMFYERYWGRAFLDDSIRMFRSELAPHLRFGDPVLELCCGTGRFAQWLTEQGYEVTGIDHSRAMLAYASQRLEPTRLIQCDARSFHLPRRFRAVVCFYNSLNQFLECRSLCAVLASGYRHLEPGGWFLFNVVSEHGYGQVLGG